MNLDIGLIGYGEVGKIFTSALKAKTSRWVGAWDLKFANSVTRDAELAHAAKAGIEACDSAAALCGKANLIIGAVTASNTTSVAQEVARAIQPGTFYLDFNSASPGTKQQCAALIDAAGGHYVEAGVMNSVPPYGIKVPMLFGGAHAQRLAELLNPLGMDAKPVSEKIGVASAIKMCRSVMIKGLEALVMESFATARAYGVEEHMISTLYETYPGIDWNEQGAYLMSRVVMHGKRRSEEMWEAANTVREAGFEPLMTSATAAKQAWVAGQKAAGVFDGLAKDVPWQDYADRLLKHSLQKK
jgi:3-hydroxyisobutyrate dehydrogenase-like beta-hydroxyacid dehydrogenase